ncbi:MAG: hypothetical protein ACLR8Y_04825 [Alistipes indistinctus]
MILEPLNRKEAHCLRQVADAASICRDTGSRGVCCTGACLALLTAEETSDYGALWSGAATLRHIHIASRGTLSDAGRER